MIRTLRMVKATTLRGAKLTTLRGPKVKTLKGAIAKGKRLAWRELIGTVEPSTAMQWCRTLPREWQSDVEDAIKMFSRIGSCYL